MTKTNETAGPVSRRSFLRRGGAVAGGAAASTLLAAPAVLAQSPMVLKMQTSWPASDIRPSPSAGTFVVRTARANYVPPGIGMFVFASHFCRVGHYC